MRKDWGHLEGWRVRSGLYRTEPGQDYGQFLVLLPTGVTLCIIATSGDDGKTDNPVDREAGKWEHVSVHAQQPSVLKPGQMTKRTPDWGEMCIVKDLFWGDDECVVQYHPPRKDYVNTHEHVLHLWRPREKELPQPPAICV